LKQGKEIIGIECWSSGLTCTENLSVQGEVTGWHGDIAAGKKKGCGKNPRGVQSKIVAYVRGESSSGVLRNVSEQDQEQFLAGEKRGGKNF